MPKQPEPWLRGPLADAHPLLSPVLRSFQQAQEDLEAHTQGLTTGQIWARPHGLAPVGFHIRHITGSVDRLTTYLQQQSLTQDQMAALNAEMQPGATCETLLAGLATGLGQAEQIIRRIDVTRLTDPRTVGRQRLPATVIGLLIHVAEHTQRHVGQAITTATLARSTSP